MGAMARAIIKATASYIPEKVLTNQDLERMVETSDEWITSRTGMKERRIAGAEEFSSDMGFEAAKKLLEENDLDRDAIDLVIVATSTPDCLMPSTAALIQARLGIPRAGTYDLLAACTGYFYGLATAKAFVESGICRNVLLIASEKLSSFIDYQDRNTCVLFGDGASAALIGSGGEGLLIGPINWGTDGSLGELIVIPAGGCRMPASAESVAGKQHYVKMAGREVFKHAVRRVSECILGCLEKGGVTKDEVGTFVCHQANIRILDAIAEQLAIPKEKIPKTVHKYGNTSASSVGIALDELLLSRKLPKGEKLLLTAFGSGMTWGAALLNQVEE